MNGILETQQLRIRSAEAPVSFSKEFTDFNKVNSSNFVSHLLQLYSLLNPGSWNPARDPSLETGFFTINLISKFTFSKTILV